MKKIFVAVLILILTLSFCSCSSSEPEDDYSPSTYSFHDIYFELTDEWNYRTFEEMQTTEIEMYTELSRSDWDGFIDERVLIKEDVVPTFIYCLDASGANMDLGKSIETFANETEDYTFEELSIGEVPAYKLTQTVISEDGEFYYIEINFTLNDKLYSLYTMGSDTIDYNEWLSTIIDSINLY